MGRNRSIKKHVKICPDFGTWFALHTSNLDLSIYEGGGGRNQAVVAKALSLVVTALGGKE